MKLKHLYILATMFLVLITISVIQKMHSSQTDTGEIRREEWRPFIPPEKAGRIFFSRPGFSTLALVKNDATWKVETLSGVSADAVKANQILSQLNQLKAELRAEGEGLYARFGITDQEAFKIQVFDSSGAVLVDFFMGVHRAGRGVFIRLPGKSKIYFVSDDIPALFGLFASLEQAGPQPLFFADLRLVPETFEQIKNFQAIQYQAEKKITLAGLERPSVEAGEPWKFISNQWNFPVSPEKVEGYLNRLMGAHAENIVANAPEFKKEFEMTLQDGSGKILRLGFFKFAPKIWYMRREGESTIFEVSSSVFDDLKTSDVLFAAENPLQIQIDEANTVELIHDGRTETFSKASGWASAAAILDAAMHLRFLGVASDIQVKDILVLPPTHQLRLTKAGATPVEISFYIVDPKLNEIKTIISGQSEVFMVSRAFFENIFIPEKAPPVEA